ncbi:MAG: MATE family efflux transporter [Clostridia bacterium]|nr:MATE family efflux transporter [Clostridia bacterium]
MNTFLKSLFKLSIPIIIQQLIQALLNLVDTIMIGRMGSDEIAAVGIANQFFFLVMMIIFGINSGISVYIAQFWGRKDKKNIRKTMGVSLSFGILVGGIFCLIAILQPEALMRIFLKDDYVVGLGVSYLKIVAFSYLFIAISLSFQVASRGIGKTVLPMAVSALALSINTILNYGLIFGHFGLPRLGVEGAAIATLIARIIEFLLLLVVIYGSKSVLAASIKDLFSYDLKFVKQIFRKAGPVLLNEVSWSLGTIMYMWAIGQIGPKAVASYQITLSAYRFYEVIFIGFASAAGVMIGNSIGANDENNAKIISKRVIKISVPTSILVSISMYFLSAHILSFFNVTADVMNNAQYLFYIYCVYGIARVFNLMLIVGIFRGGGDTRFAMVVETSCVWGVGVPLALMSALIFKLNVVYVVWLLSTEELVKAVINAHRFKSEKWVHNVISHID